MVFGGAGAGTMAPGGVIEGMRGRRAGPGQSSGPGREGHVAYR